jgi:polar amino acid transport system substrate-binding protein
MLFKITLYLTLLSITFTGYARSKADLFVVAAENPLLQYVENNEYKGPSIEILNLLLSESNLTADINLMPWARAFNLAKKEPNMLILSIIRTPVREKQFHWIGVVSELALVFVSLADKPENKVTNDQQAKNKKIAVVRDSNGHKELTTRGFIEGDNLYLVSSLNQMFTLFINGRVDLVYVDPNMIKKFIEEQGYEGVKISFNSIKKHHQRISYIAASKNTDNKIIKRLKVAMEKLKKTKKYNQLVQQ